ncbi:formate dehydrogenase accessory sulfurtransferase FdhD [Desulfonatronum sp. SC1]|uniref:formate dehydrogenase accessory sulfurtransferase FdhD n=1 Tax=Desulfonatronum sp. SC1 TaxID=2109626 RepID=UPI000D322F5A|nr:formate dehydrogenase accessory sulfurtransferase FdhD [Desulfonatronum sp. SC1]PTN38897.1 formate dehydrogenase accessory sulfurtransferase FdhD [Desulfonatronum sp. SC1]
MHNLPLDIAASTLIITRDGQETAQEQVLVEQPVEVALNERVIGTAMVLAQDLDVFGAGFLFGQGYVSTPDDIVEVVLCEQGRVTVYARTEDRGADRTGGRSDERDADPETIITSGCGGTGRISRRMLEEEFSLAAETRINLGQVGELIRGTLGASTLQQDTHCVHACGYWAEGRFLGCFEDVGRHNAVDKVIGAILLRRFPTGGAVYTTGRLTSDMVLKCARIGIPIVLSRSAPSSLGLDIARRADLTLGGYARPGRVNIFNAPRRIVVQLQDDAATTVS